MSGSTRLQILQSFRDDSELIQNIVNDVLQKLHLRYPNELEGLVGVDEKCRNIELIMEKARVIGIWGMGGIGKTTLAKAIFYKHSHQYDSVCFLENVREQSEKLGLPNLRDVDGSTFNKSRLCSKKVFMVLDDVDSFDQLEYLCGERDDLGPNSRLIITTRDMHLLTGRVDKIYAVRTWEYPQSLHLFCLNAFKERFPQKGYEDLSARAVDYAGGIPLALKVLGSYLYRKSIEFWASALSKLEKYPDEKIQKVLRVSYDGLDKIEKDIFLDIAFFFKEYDKDDVISILDASGFYATSGIDILVDKALITISNSYTIEMHDLLEEMGLEIVRKESGGDLGRHSRLRNIEEVCDLLKNNKGTDAVEGILLDLSQLQEDLHLSADTFNKMTNLRYLKFHNPLGRTSGVMNLPIVLKPFSDKLSYLVWDGYPLKSLPPNFCAKFLVTIRMRHSNIEELWQGIQDLVNLEGIDLTGCKQLIKLPDLSRASKLKWVYISYCESLCELHPSILSLDSLIHLRLNGCIKLKSLKSDKHLRSLQQLDVDGCSSLREFSVSSDLIVRLDLRKTGVKILHSSIGRLINLTWLNLEGLRLKNLPDELCCLTSLEELTISNCIAINKQKLRVLFDSLRSLEVLYLKNCYNLSELPDNISLLSMLDELRLDGSSVERLPASIKHLQELQTLSLDDCRKLQCLPELPLSMRKLYADNCMSLVTVSLPTAKIFNLRIDGFQFSFKNCVKLDGHSFNGIMEEVMNVAFLNLFSRKYKYIRVCMPGSRLPRQFTYRTTESFITIELPSHPNLLGFISSTVLSSPSPTMQTKCEIICKCYLENGIYVETECAFTADFNSDHVFVWYDPFDYFSINGGTVSFEFSVTGRHDGLIVMKECGVRLIYVSEFYEFLSELDNKVELGVQFGLELDLQHLRWKGEICYGFVLGLKRKWDASLISEFESGCRAIEKESEKSDGVVPEPLSVLGELKMEFDKKVELGLKLGLALDMKQLELEMKDCQSFESVRGVFLKAIENEAQKSELELDEKVVLGVAFALKLDIEQRRLEGKMLRRLLNILKNGLELEESLKLEFESRRRAILKIIEKETQKSNEFVFPPVATRIWKNRTQGLKDIISLFP